MRQVKASSPEGLARLKSKTYGEAPAQSPTPSKPRVPSATPQKDGGAIWTFVTAVIIVVFIVYLATKPGDRLRYWIKLFTWETPRVVQPSSPASGEHVGGSVNSDAPTGQQYSGQPSGNNVNEGQSDTGPFSAITDPRGLVGQFIGPMIGKLFGGR